MCQPESIKDPCMKVECRHHVAHGINEGWHHRPWKFRSTQTSEAFKNCMCLVRYDDEISLESIGDMFGVSAQAVLDVQERAMQLIRNAASYPFKPIQKE